MKLLFGILIVLSILLLFKASNSEPFVVKNVDRFVAGLESESNRRALGEVMTQRTLNDMIVDTDNEEQLNALIEIGSDLKPELIYTIRSYNQHFKDVDRLSEMVETAEEEIDYLVNMTDQEQVDYLDELTGNVQRWTLQIEDLDNKIKREIDKAKILIKGYLSDRQESRSFTRSQWKDVVIFLYEIDEFDLLESLIQVDNLSKKKFPQGQEYKNVVAIIESFRKSIIEETESTLSEYVPTDVAKMVQQYINKPIKEDSLESIFSGKIPADVVKIVQEYRGN
jgi:hypothetical protein